ncbi:MAG: aminoglycoside phosphotransferase family protein [Chloroflexi bacterium]|nr:aminoglycoside phosphotransferase family protein [Chloroflexota bacterium]
MAPGSPHAAASAWAWRPLDDLLAAHGLAGIEEVEFPNDGWSGAALTAIDGPSGRFILKRTSWAVDWIARSTRDHAIREAVLAADPLPFPPGLVSAHLGAAADGNAAAILMPDLSAWLIPWDRREGGAAIVDGEALERVLAAAAAIHAMPWADLLDATPEDGTWWPWCPVRERVQLLSRESATRYRAGGVWVGDRFLAGWDAFDRLAPGPARDVVEELTADPGPLIAALERLPATGLHGDLKAANIALLPDGRATCIDWQLTTFAPVAIELGWLLVANVAQLAEPPDTILERYRAALEAAGGGRLIGDWAAQRDLAILVGLLLRGWRKGLDAAAGAVLPTGVAADDDLAWWSDEAVAAASRRL